MDSVERLCENIALINKSQVVLSGNINDIRKQFSNNKIVVTLKDCKSPLTNDFGGADLLTMRQDAATIYAEFALDNDISPNDLLTHLTSKGTIQKFEAQLASMNDIFLETVKHHK